MKNFDRYTGKGQMGNEKFNADFFSVNLWNSTKETTTKGGNNNSQSNSFISTKTKPEFWNYSSFALKYL